MAAHAGARLGRIVNMASVAGTLGDVTNAVAFLCSDLAGYVTGIELNVSGGIELF